MATTPFPKIGIKNALQTGGTLELLFLDDIYDTWDWDTWTEVRIIQDIVNKVQAMMPKVIRITIDSEGGDCGIGLSFYNYITKYARDNGAEVIVEILGMAGSIASVMAMVASKGKLYIPKNAFMVIHEASAWAWGRSADLRQTADVIDGYTAQIVDIYVQRNTKSKTAEEIAALIAPGDYWMSGQKAIDEGFADELTVDSQYLIAARIGKFNASYRNIPVALRQGDNDSDEDGETLLEKVKSFLTKPNNMSFKSTFQAFVDSLKGKTVPAGENAALEVANVISEPMETLAAGLETEFTAQLEAWQKDKLPGLIEAAVKPIQDKLTAAENTIVELGEEIQRLDGGETNADDDDTRHSRARNKAGNNGDPKNKWKGKFGAFGTAKPANA